jgi:hypothetical protein
MTPSTQNGGRCAGVKGTPQIAIDDANDVTVTRFGVSVISFAALLWW